MQIWLFAGPLPIGRFAALRQAAAGQESAGLQIDLAGPSLSDDHGSGQEMKELVSLARSGKLVRIWRAMRRFR
jgi:hypothetical protein